MLPPKKNDPPLCNSNETLKTYQNEEFYYEEEEEESS
jgi:hypothetical protein